MQKALDIKFYNKEHTFVMHVLKTGVKKEIKPTKPNKQKPINQQQQNERENKELKCILMISGSFQSTDMTGYCTEREE